MGTQPPSQMGGGGRGRAVLHFWKLKIVAAELEPSYCILQCRPMSILYLLQLVCVSQLPFAAKTDITDKPHLHTVFPRIEAGIKYKPGLEYKSGVVVYTSQQCSPYSWQFWQNTFQKYFRCNLNHSQPQKSLFPWGIWTPSNTWFLHRPEPAT